MATHDYVIANGTGAAVRSDLNGALAAIVSQNSSATEPSPSYAYQRWADTTAGVMKMRNGANNAWISLYELDGTFLAGDISLSAGAAATPSLFFTGDTNTGIYSPGADQLAISTGGTGRVFVSSAGLDVNGTGTFNRVLNIAHTAGSGNSQINFTSGGAGASGFQLAQELNSQNFLLYDLAASAYRLYVTSTGRVGIGTTAPGSPLEIQGSADATTLLTLGCSSGTANGSITNVLRSTCNNNNFWANLRYDGTAHIWNVNASEAARIDSSKRLLVGTSTARSNLIGLSPRLQVEGVSDQSASTISITRNSFDSGGSALLLAKSRGEAANAVTVVQLNDILGGIYFMGADGTNVDIGAQITGEVDGTPGTDDMPSRLVFSTTADGAASPAERMRIDSQGRLMVVATSFTDAINGFLVGGGGQIYVTTTSTACASFNRLTDDGELLVFKQANTQEGSISVSGTTVSYNGAHLSRWSQLSSGAERTEILRGSVLSNINEMCEWPDEDNEQLNRMKVSDVEGDKNVSGVFQAWDDDDDTYTDDFYCAMTGDFIIRIAEGVTVERGDLLMSAGDGTAKPQDDDIIRSKTVAKVTSTNVSCTYKDGSYCVPCVLMAC